MLMLTRAFPADYDTFELNKPIVIQCAASQTTGILRERQRLIFTLRGRGEGTKVVHADSPGVGRRTQPNSDMVNGDLFL